ncbi:MAG: 23S rRNA (guanosine(2251)-2'-O)-methyltransferase RlmB [Geminicoccaceae bacterium]
MDRTKSRRRPRPQAKAGTPGQASSAKTPQLWLWGIHPVTAALANPDRPCNELRLAREVPDDLVKAAAERGLESVTTDRRELDRLLGADSGHQGVALSVDPLPGRQVGEIKLAPPDRILVLDQVTDARNFGAILRSAACFGVGAVVVQSKHAAAANGACAKAAAGALEKIPIYEVVNLARTLTQLKGWGYWIYALDAAAETPLERWQPGEQSVLVIGAEGHGIRPLLRARADQDVAIPIGPAMESLNVSVSAGIALYALARARSRP